MSNKNKLKNFIDFLSSEIGFTFNVNNFDHRIKLQKYVYIAKEFGWNHDYYYNIYLRGPYSSSLADDYYKLDDVNPEAIISLDEDMFIELVMGKNTPWLEVASTLLSLHKSFRRYYEKRELETMVIKRTIELKNTISETTILDAYTELRAKGLLTSTST